MQLHPSQTSAADVFILFIICPVSSVCPSVCLSAARPQLPHAVSVLNQCLSVCLSGRASQVSQCRMFTNRQTDTRMCVNGMMEWHVWIESRSEPLTKTHPPHPTPPTSQQHITARERQGLGGIATGPFVPLALVVHVCVRNEYTQRPLWLCV
mmetsp:Transcript_6093/g.17402  ORF Transcript_6093/g.17402 Transcript_6093/m.17402 type:complete len:152 (-) Transcript_6093:442-897(-)